MTFALQEAGLWSYVTRAREMPREIPPLPSYKETEEKHGSNSTSEINAISSDWEFEEKQTSSREDRQDMYGRCTTRISRDERLGPGPQCSQ